MSSSEGDVVTLFVRFFLHSKELCDLKSGCIVKGSPRKCHRDFQRSNRFSRYSGVSMMFRRSSKGVLNGVSMGVSRVFHPES